MIKVKTSYEDIILKIVWVQTLRNGTQSPRWGEENKVGKRELQDPEDRGSVKERRPVWPEFESQLHLPVLCELWLSFLTFFNLIYKNRDNVWVLLLGRLQIAHIKCLAFVCCVKGIQYKIALYYYFICLHFSSPGALGVIASSPRSSHCLQRLDVPDSGYYCQTCGFQNSGSCASWQTGNKAFKTAWSWYSMF